MIRILASGDVSAWERQCFQEEIDGMHDSQLKQFLQHMHDLLADGRGVVLISEEK